ncbi:uncharacterized protein LOC125254419 [Megalobrama amblycephala]|uniref:uncharacterized protein LOC125254419 n=1 Tax=Megalobrama amblycephala TaxID=75352 RepID=UPI002013CAA1|nr:uncharacterized protein LOC125254419 [Megalobrama amblycephala]
MSKNTGILPTLDFPALQVHMYRNHSKHKPDVNRSHRCIDMSCHVQGCDFTSTNFSNLCEHLKWHIRDGKKIQCPFENCKKNFRVRSSFLSHVSRKHSAEKVVSAGGVSNHDTSTPDAADEDDGSTLSAEIAEVWESSSNKVDDVFMTNLALFYLRMQAKMLLPATTISALIAEFQELHKNGITHVLTVVSQELEKLKIPRDRIHEIVDGLSKENLLKMYNESVFRSDQTRKIFFKNNFCYVEPTQVYLGVDPNGKERFCQYVPVKATLKALLSHPSVREQYNTTKMYPLGEPHVFVDVHDGRNCRENTLLQNVASSVSIILYQDAFEVANPLGSGKKKHKLLAVYMTLGEILPHNRSAIDPMPHAR